MSRLRDARYVSKSEMAIVVHGYPVGSRIWNIRSGPRTGAHGASENVSGGSSIRRRRGLVPILLGAPSNRIMMLTWGLDAC
jgi:hypothetical protein